MILGQCMKFLHWICLPGVLFFFFNSLSALSFAYIPMWLGIQVRMMLLFLERVFILSISLLMREVDVFLFCRAWSADLESEWMINFEDLWLAVMFMTSALEIDDSFGRCFSSSWFWKIAAKLLFIPYLDPSV